MSNKRNNQESKSQKYAAVLVFGDIGRSPRMQNHAYEIATNTDYHVYLVGFKENKPYQKIEENENITIVDISSSFIDKLKKLPRILYLVYAVLRVFIQMLQLFHIFLFKINTPDFVIVQNPPSIPVLSSIFLICKMIGMKMIVDFHNYGYTILALGVKSKPLVWIATKYEKLFARRLDFGLCVSHAMKKDLKENWNVDAVVVYDKPNKAIFQPLSIESKHNVFKRLGMNPPQSEFSEETLFTEKNGSQVILKKERPILLISSTSWTKDEDFGILFEAMETYEAEGKRLEKASGEKKIGSTFCKLHLIITGKGPEKERYMKVIDEKKCDWKYITIETKWLEADDYPQLLASADMGICLHYSSSGVDLPMKVVDMFGTLLPVAAIDYKCINELVRNGETGFIFKDSQELGGILKRIFGDYPKGVESFEFFKRNIAKFRENGFDDEWRKNVLPIVQRIQEMKKNKGKKTD